MAFNEAKFLAFLASLYSPKLSFFSSTLSSAVKPVPYLAMLAFLASLYSPKLSFFSSTLSLAVKPVGAYLAMSSTYLKFAAISFERPELTLIMSSAARCIFLFLIRPPTIPI